MQEMELYGYITSNKATKLIIDLFNKLNAGKPYKMKTITTIYQNDDIFKDNQRYPIDAPFRDFYKELTETYVPNHKLDNIFYDQNRNIKTGEYFFEYIYSEKENKFLIHAYPEDLGEEISKSYIPMLYSMVTGKKIDWENARVKTFFSKGKKEELTKILLVFGKDTLKTLEFSWLATFEISGNSKTTIQKVIREIREQEDEIINTTQGVLFSELDNVIVDFLQSQKQYEHTKNLIKDHKHTLKNFGLKGALNLLYHQIKNEPDMLKIYNYVECLNLLHDYTTDILYNFSDTPDELLLYKKNIDTYTEILNLIHNATREHDIERIMYKSDITSHPLNKIDAEDLANVFTVLLNLYSNSRNYGEGDFEINLIATCYKKLSIIFKNKKEMPDSFVQYFLNKSAIVEKGEGIGFIRDSLNKLMHLDRKCETANGYTTITLLIKEKK